MQAKYLAAMLAAFAMVTAGRWKKNEGLSAGIVLGFFGCTLGLSVMGEFSDGLADGFAFLIVFSCAYQNLPELFDDSSKKITSAKTTSTKKKVTIV